MALLELGCLGGWADNLIQLMPHKGAVAIRSKTAEQIQEKPGEFQHANSH